MTVDELVVMLRSYPGSTNVKIYDPDMEQFEPVTGMIHDETMNELALQSDDTD